MGSVVKEGYLTKRAVRGVGSNRRRWITLRENSIEWSEREASAAGTAFDEAILKSTSLLGLQTSSRKSRAWANS